MSLDLLRDLPAGGILGLAVVMVVLLVLLGRVVIMPAVRAVRARLGRPPSGPGAAGKQATDPAMGPFFADAAEPGLILDDPFPAPPPAASGPAGSRPGRVATLVPAGSGAGAGQAAPGGLAPSPAAAAGQEDRLAKMLADVAAQKAAGPRAALGDMEAKADAEAIRDAEATLVGDPDNVEKLDWLAFMYYTNDLVEKASATYRRLVELKPHKPDYRLYLGNCYFKAGLFFDAITVWSQVMDMDAPPLMKQQVQASLNQAQDLLAKWGGVEPRPPPVGIELPGAGATAGSPLPGPAGAAAVPAAGSVPVARPGSSAGRQVAPGSVPGASPARSAPQGEIADVLTQYVAGDGSGIAELEGKLAKDPNNVQLIDWLAFMYYSNGQFREAQEAYERLVAADPENQAGFYYLGNTYLKQGMPAEALGIWEYLVGRYPEGRFTRKTRRRLDEVRRRLEEEGQQVKPYRPPSSGSPKPSPGGPADELPDLESEPDLPPVAPAPVAPWAGARGGTPGPAAVPGGRAPLPDPLGAGDDDLLREIATASEVEGDALSEALSQAGEVPEPEARAEAESMLGAEGRGSPRPTSRAEVRPPEPEPELEPDLARLPDPVPAAAGGREAPVPEPVLPEPIPESEREEILAPRSAVLAAPGPIPVPPGPVAGTDPPLAPSSPPMAPPPPEPPPVSPVDAPGMAEGEQPVAEAGEPEVDAATREILDLEARFLADPNDRRVHFELAEAYLARGRAGDAVEAFRELAQAAPSPGAYLGLARACLGAGLVGDAVPVLQELVRMAPASPEARKARAVLGRIPGVEIPEAPVGPSVPPPAAAPGPQAGAAPVPGPPPAAAPKVAPVAAAPESPASVPAAARASVPSGPGSDQPPIGMERLEAILTTFLPDDRDRWLGFAHQVGGFGVGVLRTIQRLVEQDPGNLPAREFLAFVHLSHGRAAVAAKVFETLMDRRPDDARYPLYLGNTLLAAGEARAAAQRWREAARLDPESPAGLMAAYLLETLKGAVR